MRFNSQTFQGAKEFYGNYLRAGKYTVRVKSIEDILTKTNQTPQLKIVFFHKATDTEFTHFANADVENNTVARDWIYTFATACGYTNFGAGLDTKVLIGRPVNIEIKPKYSKYKNKVYNSLTMLEPYDPHTQPVNTIYDEDELRKVEESKITTSQDTTFSDFGNTFTSSNYNPQQTQAGGYSSSFEGTGYSTPSNANQGIILSDDDLPF